MEALRSARLKDALAMLRNPVAGRARQALAATRLSAEFNAAAAAASPSVDTAAPVFSDAGARMYEYATRHHAAPVWDGRSTRSGTITYVDAEWIEQYVGQQRWLAYRQSDLGEPGFVLGDQVRIGPRPGAAHIEAVGANRLPPQARVPSRVVRSGFVVIRSDALGASDLASTAQRTADRYGATICAADYLEAAGANADARAVVADAAAPIGLTFSHGAQLVLEPYALEALAQDVVDRFGELVSAAVRLEVRVDSQNADAALEAESALTYAAALLMTTTASLAIDDCGAFLTADQMYDLAVRDETRAAAFCLAAAAAQRAWPAPARPVSERTGVYDELVVFLRRAWRVDAAAAVMRQAIDALSDALARSEDPVIPSQGVEYAEARRGEPGSLQRLITLSYETVELDAGFIDPNAEGSAARRIGAREDAAALLGGPVGGAVVMAFGHRPDAVDAEVVALEMRRANVLATALAAAFARRDVALACDARGAWYSGDELIDLALERRGTAALPHAPLVDAGTTTARPAANRDPAD